MVEGRSVPVHDTHLYVEERGHGFPLVVLHGGPGLDHCEFGDYLDPLGDGFRLLLVDQRGHGRSDHAVAAGTLTLEQLASDVSALVATLGHERYAVLGHGWGGLVALQHAVDAPGAAAATIASSAVPSTRYLLGVRRALETFEPVELRAQVVAAFSEEEDPGTPDRLRASFDAQMPFHFADPTDPRIPDFLRRTGDITFTRRSVQVRIEVEDRLGAVDQPVLACTGRHDRICGPDAAEAIAARAPRGELTVFERSGHRSYAEEPERFLAVVRDFLGRATAGAG